MIYRPSKRAVPKLIMRIALPIVSAFLSVPSTAQVLAYIPTVATPPPVTVFTPEEPPPYVAGGANVIEYADAAAISHFAKRWNDASRQVVIAHFGDSHVQKGYVTEATRLGLEKARGYGGRGMLFPYSLAKTYSQNDLTSTFTGTWRTGNSMQQPPRLPVGIAGFAAETLDQDASVTLRFSRPFEMGPKRVRVFYAVRGGGYALTVSSDAFTGIKPASASPGVADIDLDALGETMTIGIHADQTGGSFTMLGVSIENRPASGVLYHNLGVGGAVYQALLQQTWFEPEIRSIKPDLVILDWGTNDLIYTKAPDGDFSEIVQRTIARVRRAAPDADILLLSPQEMNFRGRIIDGAALSTSLRSIALTNGCLYWDWYRISGGSTAAARWRADMLLGSDGVHLTARGYRLKGGLMAAALIQSVSGSDGATRQ